MDMIQSTGAPAAIGPYSQAVDTGSTVYLSGQIGQDPAGMRPACPGTVPHNSVSRTGSFSPPSGRARAGSMDFGPVLAY